MALKIVRNTCMLDNKVNRSYIYIYIHEYMKRFWQATAWISSPDFFSSPRAKNALGFGSGAG